MKRKIENSVFDEERALYHLTDATVEKCVFAGPRDGESALKEARNIEVKNCRFSLRYPFWHTTGFLIQGTSMDELTRAPVWYAADGVIDGCHITGIKCLRECERVTVKNAVIASPEFGWKCRDVKVENSSIQSEYLFFDCRDLVIDGLTMKGKYSFQYIHDMEIRNSHLDTKDAFWHSKNVTVYDSYVKGEYLGWYSENLTLINCRIVGTQPLCYCKGLKLIDCETEGCDLAFEYSDVEADLTGHIESVKNPRSGFVIADSIGEVISEASVMKTDCRITVRK